VPIGESFFWRTIEDELSTVGSYYDTPIMSLRNAVYHLLREQRFGFQVRVREGGACSYARGVCTVGGRNGCCWVAAGVMTR